MSGEAREAVKDCKTKRYESSRSWRSGEYDPIRDKGIRNKALRIAWLSLRSRHVTQFAPAAVPGSLRFLLLSLPQ